MHHERVFVFGHVRIEDREVQMMYEMDQVKQEACETLAARQKLGADLKLRSDRVALMSELEFMELRADIKQFVTDRKVDEELATCCKFHCDGGGAGALLADIKAFGTGE